VEQIQMKGAWILVNTGRPNAIVEEALRAGKIAEVIGYPEIRREVQFGSDSRVDFLLEGAPGKVYLEVKNATLREGNQALFPDSVSTRASKHVRELMAVVGQAYRAILLFHIGRSDVNGVSPAEAIDPEYATTLRQAANAGVELLAY